MAQPRSADADVVPGEYSLALTASESAGVITLNVIIEHDGVSPGNYQAVQWEVDYDQSAASLGAIVAAPGAPQPQCAYTSDNGNTLLAGCIDLQGDLLELSGTAYVATFNCIAEGTASFAILTEGESSLVATTAGNKPIHVHNVEVDCSGSSPDAVTPVPTMTPDPRISTRVAEVTAQAGGTVLPQESAAPDGATTPDGGASVARTPGTGADGEGLVTGATDNDDGGGDSGAVVWIVVAIVVAAAAVLGGGAVYYARIRNRS
jgi:hypothetical protein